LTSPPYLDEDTPVRKGRKVLAAVLVLCAVAWTANVRAQNICTSSKTKLAGKKAAAILTCYGKASLRGRAVDAACVHAAESRFVHASQRVDARQNPSNPRTLCPNGSGDEATAESVVDVHVDDVAGALDPGFPGFSPSLCTSRKLTCAAKKVAAVLGCEAKALGRGVSVDPRCIATAKAKFSACFATLEADEVPPNASGSNLCAGPDRDAAAIEGEINAFVSQLVTFYTGAGYGCPTAMTFTPAANGAVLDIGWSGFGHDNPFVSDAAVTVSTTCSGSAPSCGVCSYTGPIENAPGQLQSHRCLNDSSTPCATDGDCGAGDHCAFFFGSYLPFTFGGLTLCLANTWNGPMSGTTDLATGASAGTARLRTGIYFGYIDPTMAEPCPKCTGDAAANDGLRGGVCSGGVRAGMVCDANGSSPNPSLGTTSLDCPPAPSSVVSTQTLDLSNTTGNKTMTLTTASPDCRAAEYGGRKCQCDTCDNAAATLCRSDADCVAVGATRCGGKRCIGGSNAGSPCSVSSECPGLAACGVPGPRTQPNSCDGGADDCVVGDNAMSLSPNERVCASGPFELYCSPGETFRGCIVDSDCPRPGDTCRRGKFRECFDTGTIGDVVTASGRPDVRIAHQAHPTLAALFCVNVTHDTFVDTMGLPGLGRLELRGEVVDNGIP
jgi:hypothetical protein